MSQSEDCRGVFRWSYGKILLSCGLSIFLIVKVVWAVAPTQIMGLPRLGDDALVYVWSGANSAFASLSDSHAVRDIERLYGSSDPISKDEQFELDRVSMRVIGSEPSPWWALTGGLISLGLSPTAVFAVLEVITAVTLAGGIAWLLSGLYGPAAAGLALLPLAFIFLPGQGLHYLIPGVLALGLGLCLCRLGLSVRPNAVAVFGFSILTLMVHPIAPVYLAAAFGLCTILRLFRDDGNWIGFGVAISLAVAVHATLEFLPGVREEIASGQGHLDLSVIMWNLEGFIRDLVYASRRQNWLLPLLTVGVIFLFTFIRRLHPAVLLCFGFGGAGVIGLAFTIPGYPGELSIRILVPIVILLTGAAAFGASRLLRNWWGRGLVSVLTAAIIVPGAGTLEARLMENINFRAAIIDHDALAAAIDRLPDDSRILYAETDIVLMSALLAGATRFGALPAPMLLASRDPAALWHAVRPTHVFLRPPQALNSLAAIGASSWERRRYGFDLDRFPSITLESGEPLERVVVRFEASEASAANMEPTALSRDWAKSSPCAAATQRRDERAPTRGDFVIDLATCLPTRHLTLSFSEDASGWIVGIEVAKAGGDSVILSSGGRWPWGRDIRLKASARDGGDVAIDFSWPALLAANGSTRIIRVIPQTPRLVDDTSGVLIMQIQH